MQTIFTTRSGKIIAPRFFVVYYNKNGEAFRKIQDEISQYNLSDYEDIVRVELYENGTESLAPKMIDCLYSRS